MECTGPFELESLKSDLVVGLSGEAFAENVQECRFHLDLIQPEQRRQGVLICIEDPIDFAAAFFATVAAGLPVILANPKWKSNEWTQLEAMVQPSFIFGKCPIESKSVAEVTLDEGSILIPTGGTTGGVKLAVHTWASLSAACRGVQDLLGGAPIHSCCLLPLFHVSGLMQLLRSFLSGGRIRFDDSEIEGFCLSLVPTQLQRMLKDAENTRKLGTARAIFVGGAAMPESVAEQARAQKLPIIPVYGMTETAAMVAAIPSDDFLANAKAGAVPIGEAKFSIDTDQRIRIQSPALFQGYHGQAVIDREDGYLTDDQGRLDSEGRLHVLGRIDRLINSGGEKIDPVEVESALLRIEGIEQVLVIGRPDTEWGERVTAYYTGVEVNELKEQLRQLLAPYKIPKDLLYVDTLPLDEKGKVNVGASLVTPAACLSSAGLDAAGGTSDAPTKRLPIRKTHNLYRGRRSIPGVCYFITLCTKERRCSLTNPSIAEAILAAWRFQHADEDYDFHCGTVMPDHIHFLFTLGDRLSLGQCLIKFKAKTKEALETVELSWQRDFYDHRLRADDSMEGFAKYIYLNPYRKSLLPVEKTWPHWYLRRDYRPEFVDYLSGTSTPPAEWLAGGLSLEKLIEEDL